MRKTIELEHYSCSMQKTAPKNTKYSRNKTILEIDHLAKGQKLKMPKTCEKRFYKKSTVVLCKKPIQKTTNIGEMRPF